LQAEPEPPVEEVAAPLASESETTEGPEPEMLRMGSSPPIQVGEPAAPVPDTRTEEPKPEPEPETIPSAPATVLADISWTRSAAGLELVLKGNGAFEPGAFTYLKFNGGDPRLLIRLMGITQPYAKNRIQVGTPEAGQIRIGYHQDKRPPELHVVVDLASMSIRVVSVETRGPDIVALLR
jgi:hypothetical protein